MGEKGKERKEERGCERVERGREREMELEGEEERGKKKEIERERWRERERERERVIRKMEREGERGKIEI